MDALDIYLSRWNYSDVILRLFSKFAHSFVAIGLLTFSKMQNSIFISQESSQYLDFKTKFVRIKDCLFLFLCV